MKSYEEWFSGIGKKDEGDGLLTDGILCTTFKIPDCVLLPTCEECTDPQLTMLKGQLVETIEGTKYELGFNPDGTADVMHTEGAIDDDFLNFDINDLEVLRSVIEEIKQ